MKNLNATMILNEAIRLICAHVPEGEISEQVLDGLADLQRTLEPRVRVMPPAPPPHHATNPNVRVEKEVKDWIAKNGNPRLSPELRELADAIGDVEL